MRKILFPRAISMKAPKKINVKTEKVLRVLRPVYGMTEAPAHWSKMYTDYLQDALSMGSTTRGDFLILKRENETLEVLVGINIDDTIIVVTPAFEMEEKVASKEFQKEKTAVIRNNINQFDDVDLQRKNQVGVIVVK